MSYSPETLLEIFLNGALTEDAQKAFDALVRQDPAFAEKVANALARNQGEAPQESVDRISASLDGKIDNLWNDHKPFSVERYVKPVLKWALSLSLWLGLSAGAAYMWFETAHWIHWQAETSAAEKLKDEASASAASSKHAKVPAKKTTVRKEAVRKVEVPAVNVAPEAVSKQQEGDSIRLALDMDRSKNVEITVMDSKGVLTRHLYQGLWKSDQHYVDWDGKNDAGTQVSAGDYTVVIDAEGKKQSGVITIKSGS